MIKCDLGKTIQIIGHPVQIAAELEEISRKIRENFCEVLDEETGQSLFEECIRASRMSEEERIKEVDQKIEDAWKAYPGGSYPRRKVYCRTL